MIKSLTLSVLLIFLQTSDVQAFGVCKDLLTGIDPKKCIDSEAEFKAAMDDPNVVVVPICNRATIDLSLPRFQSVLINSDKTIVCAGKKCTIDGSNVLGRGAKSGFLARDVDVKLQVCGMSFTNFRGETGARVFTLEGPNVEAEFVKCKFSNNGGIAEGAAMFVFDGATATINQCSFKNHDVTDFGGAVSFFRSGPGQIVDSKFIGNRASGDINDGARDAKSFGGAVDILTSQVEIRDCNIKLNTAESNDDTSFGGAINVRDRGVLTLSGTRLNKNVGELGQHIFVSRDSTIQCGSGVDDLNTFENPVADDNGVVIQGNGQC